MKTPHLLRVPVLALLTAASASSSRGDIIWSEAFDEEATAKISFNSGSATQYSFEDYSAMELNSPNPAVTPVVHNIPAAPSPIAGSLPNRGLLLRAVYENVVLNDPEPPTITATDVTQRILNVVALDEVGGNRLALTDNYRLSFDMYLRLSPSITLDAANGWPTNAGTTEHMLWGVGYNAGSPMGRGWRSSRGSGIWGWLATEGGYGPTLGADASLYKNTALLVAGKNLGKAAGVDTADTTNFFTPAFGAASSPMPSSPANQWVQAVITVSGGLVTVQYKGAGVPDTTLTSFYTGENGVDATAGTVMVGYEDASTSKSFAELDQWMLLDNMVVEDLAPASLTIAPQSPIITFTGTTTTGVWTVTNNRAVDLTVTGATFAGTDAAAFSVQTPLPLVVPANSSAPLTVAFNPASPDGIKNATMTVLSNDPTQPSYPPITLQARRSVGQFFEAHYKLDETSGTAAANSATGGSATFQVRDPLAFGKPSLIGGTGTAIGFLPAQLGTTGNYLVSTVAHTPSYTVAFWAKPEPTGAIRTLFQRDPDFANPVDSIYALMLQGDGSLIYRVNAADVLTSSQTVPDEEIHHIALTHLDTDGFGNTTAKRIRIYVDGQITGEVLNEMAVGFIDYPLVPVTQGLHIGSRTSAGSGYQGDLDDIQVFGTELSAEQIWDLYRNPGRTGPEAATLAAVDVGYTAPGGAGGATGLLNLTWKSSPSVTYSIVSSSDLVNWSPAGELTVPGATDADTTTFGVPLPATDGARRYYRVVAP